MRSGIFARYLSSLTRGACHDGMRACLKLTAKKASFSDKTMVDYLAWWNILTETLGETWGMELD